MEGGNIQVPTEADLFMQRALDALKHTLEKKDGEIDPIIKELVDRIRSNNLDEEEDLANGDPHNSKVQKMIQHIKSESTLNPSLGGFNGPIGAESIYRDDNQYTTSSTNIYVCQKCKVEFSRPSDLKRHEKTHLAVGCHICPQCGKDFARKDSLKRHANTMQCKKNREKLEAEHPNESVADVIKQIQKMYNVDH